jgi:hypothetical protein
MRAAFNASVHHSRSSIMVLGGCFKLRESCVYITTLEVRPKASRLECERTTELARAEALSLSCGAAGRRERHGTAITHKGSCLAVPLWINPVERVLEDRRGTVVVLRRDEDSLWGKAGRPKAGRRPARRARNRIPATFKPAGLDKSKGVITASYVKDPNDPRWKDDPG